MPKRVICEEKVSIPVATIRQAVFEALEEREDIYADIYAEVFVSRLVGKNTTWDINPETKEVILTIRGTEGQIKKVLSTIADKVDFQKKPIVN